MTWLLQRLANLRALETPEELVLLEGHGSLTTSLLWSRFLSVYGSPNHLAMGPWSRAVLARAEEEATGATSLPVEALPHANYVLAIGESSLETGPSWIPLVTAFSRAHRPIFGCASPRPPLSGPTPDEFFPIHPGSGGLFQLALAQVLVRMGVKPEPPISPESLARFAPDRVANQIGLPARTIEGLALCLASQKSVTVLPDETHEAEFSARASSLLRQCLGKRTWSPNPVRTAFPNWPKVDCDSVAQLGGSKPRLDWQSDDARLKEGGVKIVEALVSGYPYKASIVLLSGEGIALNDKAFSTVPTVVSFSSFLTESSRWADLLLPNHHFLEAWDIHPMGRDVRLLGLSRPVVPPQNNSRSTGDVILDLAKGIGGSLSHAMPWMSHEAAVKSLFSPEIIVKLEATGTWTVAPDEACLLPQTTPNPHYQRPQLTWKFSDAPLTYGTTAFPFLLVPARGWGDSMPDLKWIEEIPFTPGNPYIARLEIHPADAFPLGIRNGETVEVETPTFRATAHAFFRSGLRPGVVAMNRRPIQFSVCQARVRRSS
jgi:anaerobic selenocysteine-containing dehydrogenase